MQPDGVLRISGDGFGGLITHKEYANYYLVMEYRWGTKTWRNRADRARDGGLLLHCQGPDGNFGGTKEKPGPWMTSVECQIIEGGVGDILVLQGKDQDGKTMDAAATCEITRDRDGEAVWTAGGKKERFTAGDTLTYRVNGVIVNRAEGVVPTQGKILLQTEGAEMFVRKLELRPLPDKIP